MMNIAMSACALACCGLLFLMVKIAKILWWKPLQIQKHFESQGIRGPPCRLIYGNMLDMIKMREQAISRPMELSHDIIPRALSFYSRWTETYGNTFIHWFGSTARLNITDPELIWEVLCNKSGLYKKSVQMKELNGEGLLSLEGEMWAQHRRIINPAFHVEHLKGMVPMVIGSTSTMLDKWKERIESGENEIEVCKEFQNLTEDILAHTVFGSCYSEGKRVFDLQSEQTLLLTEVPRSLLRALISRFLPTRKNRYMRKLDSEIRRSLRQLIQRKKQAWSLGRSSSYGGDLISVMTVGNKDQQQQQQGMVLQKGMMSIEEIVEECKTFFFAGHDTTLCLLAWTMILLGMHPQWQDRARKEIISICRHQPPKPENVSQLKIMGMVLNESLRLYPPVVALIRQAGQDMKLGNLSVPGGTQLLFPIIALHHDPSLWGDNAKEFDPERFCDGVSKAAKHPMAFMPFGMGPRICVGQNFAVLQAKLILAMILQRFSFSLSPTYTHAPIPVVFLQPQFGAQMVMTPLSQE
uniref:Cytochrome P450 CYP866D1 n=2 Tax=Picea TaxID=3328 RepID=A0A0G7ZNR7_PICGL